MTFDSTFAALCASAGVAGGILLAWLKVFERYQIIVMVAALAGFVAVCVLGDDLSILPSPTMRAWSSLSVHFAPLIAFPFMGAWLLTFLGRRFLTDVRAYIAEQFDATQSEDAHERR